jgi:hypothetical protein
MAGEGDKKVSQELVSFPKRLEELILAKQSLATAIRCPDAGSADLQNRTNDAIATLSQELDGHMAFISSEDFSAFLKKTYPNADDPRYQKYQTLRAATVD